MVQVKPLWLCLDRQIYLSFTKVGGLFKSLTLNNNNSNDNTNNNHINISSNLNYEQKTTHTYLSVFSQYLIFKGLCTLRNFRPKFSHVENKYDLTLWQSRLHTASETFVHQKKFGSCSIFCVFASVAFTLIGQDEEYKKNRKNTCKNFGLSVQWSLDMV